ncbi:MAG TPA: glycosyltransferase family 2 protein, partial [Pirellulales bacterium]|nr:glycosyltransferase family 2 protein [Pirellulales bacterium]
ELLAAIDGIQRVTHGRNLGYGAALRSAFDFAQAHGYEVLVTIDCDGQHQPRRIPRFVAACAGWDIVSGSRYLEASSGESAPPPERRKINEELTAELNRTLGLNLTDAFCGFKAYRVAALGRLKLTEDGYAMPLELWVQAARAGLKICELPVPLIYLDATRSFGGSLDDARVRLEYYRRVLARSCAAADGPAVDWAVADRAAADGTAASKSNSPDGTTRDGDRLKHSAPEARSRRGTLCGECAG